MKKMGLALLFIPFLLSACGRTGALYLPNQQHKSSSAEQQSTQGQQDFLSMHPAPNTE